MALNPKVSILARNAEADALGALANSGVIRIYDGTQPANADTAVSGQTLLVTLTFGATAFGAASGGVITANAITPGTVIANSTPTWCRILKSDGTTVLFDGSVGTSASNLIFAVASLVIGTVVGATMTYTRVP